MSIAAMIRTPPRILQSPMVGCTDLAYRTIARRFGCEMAFCEMVKDRPVVEGHPRTLAMLRTDQHDRPVGMQLLGRDPAMLADAAQRLEQLGADVIDLNLGCPVNKVVDDGCGSALLKEPEHIGRILEKLVPAVRVPVTIKMRTGFDDGDDDRFLHIARIAGESGVAWITVHGRTRRQGYSGLSNTDAIRRVKDVAGVPVVGNGDIRCGADAKRMMDVTGCDGVMVARGALGNPWIYREIALALKGEPPPARPTAAERAAVLADHFALLRHDHGDEKALILVRPVIHWYVKGVPGAMALRGRGGRVRTFEELLAIIRDFAAAQAAPTAPDNP
ncbi:MAG: tRNA dihydrouridine synthase DusB [Planctomycetes bacterium]|nr:tRNA dihydrouridine synthase DusB [Planctomycetota bacterium]